MICVLRMVSRLEKPVYVYVYLLAIKNKFVQFCKSLASKFFLRKVLCVLSFIKVIQLLIFPKVYIIGLASADLPCANLEYSVYRWWETTLNALEMF